MHQRNGTRGRRKRDVGGVESRVLAVQELRCDESFNVLIFIPTGRKLRRAETGRRREAKRGETHRVNGSTHRHTPTRPTFPHMCMAKPQGQATHITHAVSLCPAMPRTRANNVSPCDVPGRSPRGTLSSYYTDQQPTPTTHHTARSPAAPRNVPPARALPRPSRLVDRERVRQPATVVAREGPVHNRPRVVFAALHQDIDGAGVLLQIALRLEVILYLDLIPLE